MSVKELQSISVSQQKRMLALPLAFGNIQAEFPDQ